MLAREFFSHDVDVERTLRAAGVADMQIERIRHAEWPLTLQLDAARLHACRRRARKVESLGALRYP
jgi:hypothetical protein